MKVALITGGSRGIGRAVCLKLAAMGYYVLVNYKSNVQEAGITLSQIKDNGGDGELLHFDVADRDAIRRILGDWIVAHPEDTIEVLVNNAGIRDDSLMAFMNDEQWDNVLKTNLDGFYNVLNPLIMPMVRTKQAARIVTLASVSGLIGNRGQVNYSAAKAGIIGATKALAIELASRGITVNCVAPGLIETDMLEKVPLEEAIKLIPARRIGKPEEVAAVVSFLMKDDAAYVTRQVISVNGGMA